MNKAATLLCVLSVAVLSCAAQESSSNLPDAPQPAASKHVAAGPVYSPPSQKERFKNYLARTYGPIPVVEGAIRGAIQYERGNPPDWPQDGQGFADRFGSAMGEIAVRGTTEYVLSDLFSEDLRVLPCGCSESAFTRALADTFTAGKGEDGHRAFSVARMAGPISGSLVAYKTWYPSDTSRNEIGTEIGLNYGFVFLGNLVRESVHH